MEMLGSFRRLPRALRDPSPTTTQDLPANSQTGADVRQSVDRLPPSAPAMDLSICMRLQGVVRRDLLCQTCQDFLMSSCIRLQPAESSDRGAARISSILHP